MTYCIGFKSITAVFLIADSMITTGTDLNVEDTFGDYTTFGELVNEENKTMHDGMMKVFKLPGNVLVTFAGDVKDALEVIGIFKTELERGLEPLVAFEKVSSSGPFSQIELLVGFMQRDMPKLYSYNYNGNGEFKEEHSTIHLGSGRDHAFLCEKSSVVVEDFSESYSDGKTLVFTLAFLQNFTIKNTLIPLDAGGFFFGGYVHSEGIQRIWNTTYLMYAVTAKNNEKTLTINSNVSMIRKDDSLMISSSYIEHERFYLQEIDSTDTPTLVELQNQFENFVDDYWEGKFKFVVLLNQLNYGFTVCHMESESSKIKIISDRTTEEVTYRLSSDLVKHLSEPYTLLEEYINPEWDRNNPAHMEIPVTYFS